MRRGRGTRILLASTIVVALALVAAVVAHRLGPKHFGTVAEGALYRSGQLTPGQLADVVEEHGIRTVVNLRSENERSRGDWYAHEHATAADLDVSVVDLPMNSGFPPKDEIKAEWLDLLNDPGAHPILVHCEYGVVRTGIMVGIYHTEYESRSPERIRLDIEDFGGPLPETIRDRIDVYFRDYRSGGSDG